MNDREYIAACPKCIKENRQPLPMPLEGDIREHDFIYCQEHGKMSIGELFPPFSDDQPNQPDKKATSSPD